MFVKSIKYKKIETNLEMTLSKTAILAVRLLPYKGNIKDTCISDKGLIASFERGDKECYLGEIPYETHTLVKSDTLNPRILKAYYTTSEYPKVPKLKVNRAQYHEAHMKFRESFKELPIEKHTAFWLVRRVGFDKLRPPVIPSGTLSELGFLVNPMVDISNMIPALEIKKGVLQITSPEKAFLSELSKALDDLRGKLFITEIDIDSVIQKTSPDKRKKLLKNIKDLTKQL